jgi:hypothetical protein
VSSAWCTGVGSYDLASGYATLAELWNGHVWAVESTPSTNHKSNLLDSVSCTSTVACDALGTVGSVNPGGLAETIAESWNGAHWRLHIPPAP